MEMEAKRFNLIEDGRNRNDLIMTIWLMRSSLDIEVAELVIEDWMDQKVDLLIPVQDAEKVRTQFGY